MVMGRYDKDAGAARDWVDLNGERRFPVYAGPKKRSKKGEKVEKDNGTN